MRILIIGGTGFVGRHLMSRLSSCEHQVILPIRSYKNTKDLRILPFVSLTESDINDHLVLEQLVSESDVVINLLGILNAKGKKWPYNSEFYKYHVELPKQIAIACQKHNVKKLLHFSALGANSSGPSMYLRSKGDGEKAICEIFSNWTQGNFSIIRPSIIFGPGDKSTITIAKLAHWLPFIPISYSETLVQPIYVNDVVDFTLKILDSEFVSKKFYELGGPKIYSLKEFVRLCAVYSGNARYVYSLPKAIGYIPAFIFEFLTGSTLISRDNLNTLSIDNVCNPDLSVDLTFSSFESIATTYLNRR